MTEHKLIDNISIVIHDVGKNVGKKPYIKITFDMEVMVSLRGFFRMREQDILLAGEYHD